MNVTAETPNAEHAYVITVFPNIRHIDFTAEMFSLFLYNCYHIPITD